MKDDDAFSQLRAHAGYVYPDTFVENYIRTISYRMLALKPFHIQILSAIKPGNYGKQINVQAPRGTGKTTLVNRLIPLWRICYKAFDLVMDRQPEEFILIVGRNERMAIQRLIEIRRVIEQNPLIRRDFGDLVGTSWTKTETDTRNGIGLRPLGRGASPRGALLGDVRPTLKLCDDIEDPKRCLNPELREEDRDWFLTDFMYAGDHLERVGLPYVKTLEKMGIGITARTIEPSNYVSRLRRRKFDATILGIGGSLTPGVELRSTFGSYAADVDSSRNLMGIKDPVVDELVEKVIEADSRPKLIAAARALDRVLLWNFYGIPGFYAPGYRFIYWDRLSRPAVVGKYRPGFPDTWWWDEQKAHELDRAQGALPR